MWIFILKVGEGEDQNIYCHKIWFYYVQKMRIEKTKPIHSKRTEKLAQKKPKTGCSAWPTDVSTYFLNFSVWLSHAIF